MLFISKRKIIIFLVFILIILLTLLYIRLDSIKDIISTVNLVNYNKVVVLDARASDIQIGGAVSDEGISEADINLKITLKVKQLLEEAGIKVILTRSNENGIYDEKTKTLREQKISDIKNRVKIGNESKADIFVSIHLNKIPQKQYWGWQTFFKEGNEESKKIAEEIQKGLNETIEKENKRQSLKIKDIYIVENVKIPTAIVECGFLSNEEEEKLLQTDEYQNKLSKGIYKGITNYLAQFRTD